MSSFLKITHLYLKSAMLDRLGINLPNFSLSHRASLADKDSDSSIDNLKSNGQMPGWLRVPRELHGDHSDSILPLYHIYQSIDAQEPLSEYGLQSVECSDNLLVSPLFNIACSILLGNANDLHTLNIGKAQARIS